MSTTTQRPVLIYTEQTPNPRTLKFVTNKMLHEGTAEFKDAEVAAEWSPMAEHLLGHESVEGVYFCNNFMTLTKTDDVEWGEVSIELKEMIKTFVQDGGTVVKEGYEEVKPELEAGANDEDAVDYSEKEKQLVVKIKELLDTYVKPAVESDGGNIEFKKFVDGKVHVIMQGACSGCPSSTATLKGGIEGMLKRMVPEVTEVVAEMG